MIPYDATLLKTHVETARNQVGPAKLWREYAEPLRYHEDAHPAAEITIAYAEAIEAISQAAEVVSRAAQASALWNVSDGLDKCSNFVETCSTLAGYLCELARDNSNEACERVESSTPA